MTRWHWTWEDHDAPSTDDREALPHPPEWISAGARSVRGPGTSSPRSRCSHSCCTWPSPRAGIPHPSAASPPRRHGPCGCPRLPHAGLPAREDGAINGVLARMPAVTEGGPSGHEVALTFDDGPGPYSLRWSGRCTVSTCRRRSSRSARWSAGSRPPPGPSCATATPSATTPRPTRSWPSEPRRPASAAARPDRGDRTGGRALPAAVPPALRLVQRHDAARAAPPAHADGAVVDRHLGLPAPGRAGDRAAGARRGTPGRDHPAARRRGQPQRDDRGAARDRPRAAPPRADAVTVPRLLLDDPPATAPPLSGRLAGD